MSFGAFESMRDDSLQECFTLSLFLIRRVTLPGKVRVPAPVPPAAATYALFVPQALISPAGHAAGATAYDTSRRDARSIAPPKRCCRQSPPRAYYRARSAGAPDARHRADELATHF